MFLCDIAESSWVENTAISLASSPKIATNRNVSLNSTNNGIIINTPGWYNVKLQAVVDATSTSIGAVLTENGEAVTDTEVTVTTIAQDNAEIYIEYPVRVVSAGSPAQALIQFNATAAGTGVNGYVTVERIS